VSAPAMSAELMNRTRVRLSGEERMKFSAHCSRPLARDRTANRLRKVEYVEAGSRYYVCIVNDKKVRRPMGGAYAPVAGR
jgi:hypothetical protein